MTAESGTPRDQPKADFMLWDRLGSVEVTANVINRTVELFSLHEGNHTVGTGFTIEGPTGRQYLVTARHVFEHLEVTPGERFRAWNAWSDKTIEFAPLPIEARVDIAVTRLDGDLTDRLLLTPTSNGAIYGGPVRMIGFPSGLGTVIGNQGKVGFVRQGVIAGSQNVPVVRWWFDMRSNPGYSGAPVVFKSGGELRVMAVYAGSVGVGDEDPLPGFGVGYDIRYAQEAIEADAV